MRLSNQRGTTLTELLVAMAVFAGFIALLYPAFTFFKKQSSHVSDKQMLSLRGNQILNYLAEEVKMAGFLVGPASNLSFCGGGISTVNHSDGDRFDTLDFLTSIPVERDVKEAREVTEGNYFLTLTNDFSSGSNSFSASFNSKSMQGSTRIKPTSESKGNARSLITFETLSPTTGKRVYEVSGISSENNVISISGSIDQTVPGGSMVYSVQRLGFQVDGDRQLSRVEWDADCGINTVNKIDFTSGNDNILGGVDGLQYEFFVRGADNRMSVGSTIGAGDLENLAAIRIWVLLKAEVPDSGYTNDEKYVLGTLQDPDNPQSPPITGVVLGPYNDSFRRLLLTKAVEVKNLVYK
ncbi:MAG: prepilin-type N-terminal cleavage/methylation domain-containing protein [Nitrospirae bacterium]|nr:prepilin-type N-terminal cleavage/methylation domain-containing protein [Nitrospirota bacterium]